MNRAEFHYRVPWRTNRVHPGAHPSRQAGGGLLFQRFAAFVDHPDPRRLDLRATVTNPYQTYQVRVYEQRGCINVFAIVDLSASMGYRGKDWKMRTVADFIDALAISSHRTGDAMGLVGCSEGTRPPFYLPATRQHGAVRAMAATLRRFRPHGTHARGLLQAARLLPAGRCLVFLVSDFHYPLTLLRQIMASLSRHDVVPVAIWDREEEAPRDSGLAKLRDMESGMERLLWLRPELRARLMRSFRERRTRLASLCRRFGREPLFLQDGFDPEAVTRYFFASL